MPYEPQKDRSHRLMKWIVIAGILIAIVHVTVGYFLVSGA